MCNAVNIVMGDTVLFVVILHISTPQRGWWSNSTARSSRDAPSICAPSQGRRRGGSINPKPRDLISAQWSYGLATILGFIPESPFEEESLCTTGALFKKKKKKKKTSRAATSVSALSKVSNAHPQSAPSFSPLPNGPNVVVDSLKWSTGRSFLWSLRALNQNGWCVLFLHNRRNVALTGCICETRNGRKRQSCGRLFDYLTNQNLSLCQIKAPVNPTGHGNTSPATRTSPAFIIIWKIDLYIHIWDDRFPSQEHWQFMEGLFIDAFVYY